MKFLSFTDMHYSDVVTEGERKRPMSLEKVKKALAEHGEDCDFIVNFGDTADLFEEGKPQTLLWKETADVLKNHGKKYYCLIGNHDTSTDKKTWAEIMGMPSRYYSFECDGYKILVLDPNQNDEKNPYPAEEIEWAYCYIDDEQFDWMKKEIEEAEGDVIIFSHELFILGNRDNDDDHVIRNREKLIRLAEESGKVKAVFSGHYHYGDRVTHNGTQYITFRSICLEDDYAHYVVTVDGNGIDVQEYGVK